jgi:hypothetical protein
MALEASFFKPSAIMRPRSHLFLLLTFLLSTMCLCSSSEESLIIDPIFAGPQESPLSITSTTQSEHHRQLVEKEGNISLLVVRVSGRNSSGGNSSPSMDSASLYNSIFVKEASLRKQYDKCSAGKLNIYPTDKGVLEVRVNMDINGANVADVIGAADIEGLRLLRGVSSFRDYADLTMFVVPPGTSWRNNVGWTAYAVIGGKGSVVNDSRVNYLGVQMHELGHNFGLNHADGINDPFGDITSHMGRSLLDMDFPIKCFNAQNHWQLGWYSDRSITINPNVSQKVKILGFVDYKKAIQGQDFVVAKVGENLYLQFNRAKLHNIDTEEAEDKLVIIVDKGGVLGTTLVAELDDDNTVYTNNNFESSGKQLNVEVCRTVIGSTDDDIDWMEVSIGYGPSVCGAQLLGASAEPEPSPQPSLKPSLRPTDKPTRQPSYQPSSQPTSQPSSQPTSQPSSQPTSQPSSQPSHQPSSQPTSQPSSQPSSQPTSQPSSSKPSSSPSSQPTSQPSSSPQPSSSHQPSSQPTSSPSSRPTSQPSLQPTSQPSSQPSQQPSSLPTSQPSSQPSQQPSSQPTSQPSSLPSQQPSSLPTSQPSSLPTSQPSSVPTSQPSSLPTPQPTSLPTSQPSSLPTSQPSSLPSHQPSSQPTSQPSSLPTSQPSSQPSHQPSSQPTSQPSSQPTARPAVDGSVSNTLVDGAAPSSEPTPVLSTQGSGRSYDRGAVGGTPPSRVVDRLNGYRGDGR